MLGQTLVHSHTWKWILLSFNFSSFILFFMPSFDHWTTFFLCLFFVFFFLFLFFLRSDTFVSGTLPSPYRTTFIFPLIFSALSTNSNHFQTVIFVHFFSLTKLTQANNFNCQHLRPLQLLAGLDLMHHYQHHNAHLFGYNIFCVVSPSSSYSILWNFNDWFFFSSHW